MLASACTDVDVLFPPCEKDIDLVQPVYETSLRVRRIPTWYSQSAEYEWILSSTVSK